MVMEADGKHQSKKFIKPFHCKVGNWQGTHPFLYIPGCPTPLQGRELLCQPQTRMTLGKLEVDNFLCLLSEYLQSDVEKEEFFPFLDEVNPQVWVVSSPGLAINVSLMKILLRPNAPYPWKRQYPLKPEVLEGLRPLVNKYQDIGIPITCVSPCNTPIFPVKKPDGSYRFIQDLRAVNEAVVPIHPIVPNPYTLLSQVPGNAKYFSVLDLKDAFFCIPLHPESPKFFAFEWRDLETREAIQLCWTWLPQGFRDRPHIFGTSLGRELRELTLTNSNLIQYVDDLLIASPNFTSSQMDTIKTLNFLWVLYLIQKKRVIEYPPRKLRLA